MDVRNLGNGLLDLLFPPKCPFCGRLSPGICSACGAVLPWTGQEDSLRNLGTPADTFPPLLCVAPLRYEGLARRGMLRMKFQGHSGAAEPMGFLIAQVVLERFGREFDAVTWVPVSARRRRKRGYDQAELLCRAAARQWETVPERLVDKIRNNQPQSSLSDPEQRRANVKSVYRLRSSVTGRRIVLIDDICTTGSTLRSCASVLLEGGAAAVACAVVAFAGSEHTA